LAAGCVGTTELLLRCQQAESIPGLSQRIGYGFSTNGDYIAFLPRTRYRFSLTRGPVTTYFAHFNTPEAGANGDPEKFHTIEDQGIPPAFASLVGVGLPLIRSLSKGRNRHLFLLWAIFLWALKQLKLYVRAPFVNARERQEMFKTEDEIVANMMCVVGIGREAAVGQFRLGGFGQTSLRVKRTDNKEFYEDPIYKDIEESLKALEPHLRADNGDDEKSKFRNPFLSNVFRRFNVDSITLSHPLGGCRMAKDVEHGVVDEYGRVFDERKEDQGQKVYEGLYIADGSIIPTALGVNPSLTISALALRIVDNISKEL